MINVCITYTSLKLINLRKLPTIIQIPKDFIIMTEMQENASKKIEIESWII